MPQILYDGSLYAGEQVQVEKWIREEMYYLKKLFYSFLSALHKWSHVIISTTNLWAFWERVEAVRTPLRQWILMAASKQEADKVIEAIDEGNGLLYLPGFLYS